MGKKTSEDETAMTSPLLDATAGPDDDEDDYTDDWANLNAVWHDDQAPAPASDED